MKKGFTLIELLVVISIVSLLSTVALTNLSLAREKAKYAKAKADVDQLMKMIVVVGGESGKTMMQVFNPAGQPWIGSSVEWPCRSLSDIRNIPDSTSTGTCMGNWINFLQKLEAASNGMYTGLVDKYKRDPWGSPYLLDVNEVSGTTCSPDWIGSAGPDGNYNNPNYFKYLPLYSPGCGR